jgi:DMSO/TMAO reductase YedYZ molybdopterin-dependent catalytic subunit
MKTKKILSGAALGGLVTAPLISLLYLTYRLIDLAFPPFAVFNTMSRLLPGPVITFGIDAMISGLRLLGLNVAGTAKTAEQIMAVIMFWSGGVIFGAGLALLLERTRWKAGTLTGLLAGLILGIPASTLSLTAGITGSSTPLYLLILTALFLGWGYLLTFSIGRILQPAETADPEADPDKASVEKLNRRQFLVTLGAGTATVTVVGAGLGELLTRTASSPAETPAPGQAELGPAGEPFPNAGDPVQPVAGTRPEYTPVEDHYKVFIEVTPENIQEEDWTLPVTGLVDSELELTLQDIREKYPARSEYITLNCISGRIPTTLISTTYWTGVSVQDVLDEAGVQEDAQYLYIESEDGFYEIVDLDLIYSDPRIMFCYSWDGEPLPKDHGFPLRIWIPDRFGMKQPKWITRLELRPNYQAGYWVERGWSKEAIVKARSVVDTVAVEERYQQNGQDVIPFGGIAFAGDRGISKVEVRIDDGSWVEADLRSPLSGTTWVIWRYDWPFQEGQHTFAVRAYDGNGDMQILEESDARPDGATGLHSVTETIS